MYFFGTIANTRRFLNYAPFFVWKKSKTVPEELYNPELVTKRYEFRDMIFSVVRDDLLPGGTWQRVFVRMMEDLPYKNFYMFAEGTSHVQTGGAYAAKLTGKTFTVYLLNKLTEITREAAAMTTNFKYFVMPGKYKNIREYQTDVDELMKDDPTSFKIIHGDIMMVDYLSESISRAFPKNFKKPERIWITIRDGTMLRSLYKNFPDSHVMAVQIGNTYNENVIDRSRTTIYVAPQYSNYEVPKTLLPPYPSEPTYDAKVWQFFVHYGREGDMIWNVTGKQSHNF